MLPPSALKPVGPARHPGTPLHGRDYAKRLHEAISHHVAVGPRGVERPMRRIKYRLSEVFRAEGNHEISSERLPNASVRPKLIGPTNNPNALARVCKVLSPRHKQQRCCGSKGRREGISIAYLLSLAWTQAMKFSRRGFRIFRSDQSSSAANAPREISTTY